MTAYRTVLVTGCPRSGTTPVGANLALAPGARYLYEPFNPRYGLRAITRYYEVPGANDFSLERLDACVSAIRRLRLELRRYDWPEETPVRRMVKRVVGSRSQVSYWICRLDWMLRTVIWKDPIACFASAAVADRHGIPVLVTARPAVAVAASYRRMGWQPGTTAVLASLSQAGISTGDLTLPRRWEENPVIGAAVLWYLVYHTLLGWAESRPAIRFVSLQESIDRPLEVYRDLYGWLGLEWTARVTRNLERRYQRRPAGEATASETLPVRAHVSRRRIDEVNTYGRSLLTADETRIIEDLTAGVWERLSAACRRTGAGSRESGRP